MFATLVSAFTLAAVGGTIAVAALGGQGSPVSFGNAVGFLTVFLWLGVALFHLVHLAWTVVLVPARGRPARGSNARVWRIVLLLSGVVGAVVLADFVLGWTGFLFGGLLLIATLLAGVTRRGRWAGSPLQWAVWLGLVVSVVSAIVAGIVSGAIVTRVLAS